MKNTDALFGIYIHWPFCAAKCPYCDFNSHVREAIDHTAWEQAYIRELSCYAEGTKGRTVTSIFFGGGTPSLMEPDTAGAVIGHIRKTWPVADDVEITLEANPTSVEAGKFTAFRAAGINRVSIGVQALNDDALHFLGRRHNVKQALKAIETAGKTFDRSSFDLIYARPEQSLKDWSAELSEALALANGHLSLYQLTIERGTAFHTQHERGDFSVPEQDDAGRLYELTQDIMNRAGLPAYEVSNHAAPGQESVHNLAYWRAADYIGAGPGAHGRLTRNGQKIATRNHKAPEIWIGNVREKGHGAHPPDMLSAQDRFAECLMMGLRLREGVPLNRLELEGKKPWQDLVPENKITPLLREGLMERDETHIRPTMAGMQRLNAVLGWLLA